MKKIVILSMLMLVMVSTSSAQDSCITRPSCADMGYTKTVSDCSGKTTLKCPFDLTKVSCEDGDSSSGGEWDWENMINCLNLNYTYGGSVNETIFSYTAPVAGCAMILGTGYGISDASGNNKLTTTRDAYFTVCVDEGYIFKEMGNSSTITANSSNCYFIPYKNAIKPKDSNSCLIGDYYFDDGTCSFFNTAGKTVIGIVVNAENRIIMSMEKQGSLKFATDLTYYDNVYENLTSTSDGQLNMNKLVSAGITKFPVAKFCKGLTVGNKTWYVPASEEFFMNGGIASRIGVGYKDYFWTSTRSKYSSEVIVKRGDDMSDGAYATSTSVPQTHTTLYAICVAKY